jgi:hypothetical protein
MNGKKVRCAKCNQVMVAAPDGPAVLEVEEAVEEPVAPAARKARVVREDDAPEAPLTVQAVGDDEGVADEEEPRERKRKKKARKSTVNADDLAAVAFFQRAILLCILGNLIAGVLFVVLPPDIGALFWFALIPVGLASTVFVMLLARALMGTVAGIVLGLLTLVPLLGLIVLLVVNQMATRRLKSNGVKVGLLGASMPSGGRAPLGSVTLPMIAGALTLVVAVVMAGGYFLFVDHSGPWPDLPPIPGARTPTGTPDESVLFHIAGVDDPYTHDAIRLELAKLGSTSTNAPGRATGVASAIKGGRMTARVYGVSDAQAASKRIEFGNVRRVSGNTITIDAKKLEGLPAEGDEVGKAVYDLKSPMPHKQREGLTRLKNAQPNDRRDEVIKELTRILQDKNRFDKEEAAQALLVWAGKDKAVPILIESIPQSNFVVQRKLAELLASTKDERAIEPLVQLFDDFAVQREAAKALKDFGPKAAPAVAKRLSSKDRAKMELACEVLKEIGTADNIPELEKIARNRADRGLALAANNAIKAIKARQ